MSLTAADEAPRCFSAGACGWVREVVSTPHPPNAYPLGGRAHSPLSGHRLRVDRSSLPCPGRAAGLFHRAVIVVPGGSSNRPPALGAVQRGSAGRGDRGTTLPGLLRPATPPRRARARPRPVLGTSNVPCVTPMLISQNGGAARGAPCPVLGGPRGAHVLLECRSGPRRSAQPFEANPGRVLTPT